MRFSVQLPTDRVEQGEEFTGRDAVVEMVRAVERAGFDACFVTDHPFPPDAWLARGGHHTLDPFVVLGAAAVASRRLRLHTHVLVLAYRNPFLMAKAIASLDVLSGGRVIAGVAVGYLEGEYRALGADFDRRNAVADEALRAMKQAWSGGSVRFTGIGYEARSHTMLPTPLQKPYPPLWVGGNSDRAMRRAVEHAQGWSPFPVSARFSDRARTSAIESVDDLAEKIERLRATAREAGRREPLDVNFVPFGRQMGSSEPLDPAAFREQVRCLEAIGVTWLSVGLPCSNRAHYLENVARFGEQVIARLRRSA